MEKDKKITIISSVITGVLTLAIGLGVGFGIGSMVNALSADEQKLVDEYRVLRDDWLYGNEEQYLNDLAMQGMATGVASDEKDSYTFYTSTSEAQGLSTDGKGFGFTSHFYDGGLYVVEVYSTSNANVAGLKAGDVLYSCTVDNKSLDFKTVTHSQINAFLSSVQNTTSVFTFQGKRNGEDISISMTRGSYSQDLVKVIQAPTSTNKNTMVVKVNTFLGSPTLALQGSLQNYEGKIDDLVLDLRGNGGGYVTQAANMAKLFVKKGTLLYQLRDKSGNVSYSETQQNNPTYDIPHFSILMDGGTASASEIFILAMRAGCDCTTYGLKSYGKGIAQDFKTFSDNSVLRYTYAYVYGPEKENETMYEEGSDSDDVMCIHGKGILPDVAYTYDYSYLESAVEYNSIGISEYYQNYFLKALNDIYPNTYPSGYSSSYHFDDAIRQYANAMAVKYNDASLTVAFKEDGSMLKAVNDLFNKDTYDQYLAYSTKVMSFVLEKENDR